MHSTLQTDTYPTYPQISFAQEYIFPQEKHESMPLLARLPNFRNIGGQEKKFLLHCAGSEWSQLCLLDFGGH